MPGVYAGSTPTELETLKTRLRRQGLDVALKHLSQAESTLSRREWEAANGQVRSFLEAVFDSVVGIRLSSEKRGGTGRKELESRGILGPREARLVQQFIEVAGGAGSHAGSSNEDEAKGRFLAALGVAYMGLSLIPEVRRLEDIIGAKLHAPPGTRLPSDADMRTACPTCGLSQSLGDAQVRRDGLDTIYQCRNGCQTIVVVSSPESDSWQGAGYRLGDFVIRNAKDIYLPLIGGDGEVRIPASPAALMRRNQDL